MQDAMNDPKAFLEAYKIERLPLLQQGVFEGAQDDPDFTVDQRREPLNTQEDEG